MRILLINPNTSEFVTDRAVEAARKVAAADTVVKGVTGSFGAPIINSETDMVVGAHSAVDLAAVHAAGFDAVGLAVSFDTGLAALREMLTIPVAGLAESSIRLALEHSRRIALVSFGERTRPLYERLALRYMHRDNLAGVRCMEALSAAEMNDPDYLQERIELEVEKTTLVLDCDAVVLLATAFAGLSDSVTHKVPVIDCVAAMIRELESSNRNEKVRRMLTDEALPQHKLMHGVSEDLSGFYRNLPSE
ncbi:MAG: aspartate/glutamate racemase family protein [Acidiferrobacterales bacterium]|nr:aspartate/glutamate racemase family protein [Acidiferrobacterales bacterium]